MNSGVFMAFSHKILFSLVFSVASLGLGGCGGGSSNPPAPTPGNCAAGQTYSSAYGCLSQGNCGPGMGQTSNGQCVSNSNTTISSCQQTNQGPMVYSGPQYGCLPQGNCPAGEGDFVQNGMNKCIPGQMGGVSNGCPAGQLMTEKGCLPQSYQCGPNGGIFQGRCYSGANGEVVINRRTRNQDKSIDERYDTYESDDSDDSDDSYVEDSYYEEPIHSGICVKIKHRARGTKIKIKTRGRCRN
jgi:hypothetical protein